MGCAYRLGFSALIVSNDIVCLGRVDSGVAVLSNTELLLQIRLMGSSIDTPKFLRLYVRYLIKPIDYFIAMNSESKVDHYTLF